MAVAVYSAGRNVIIGTDEKDSLHSNSSNSIILGGSGDDELTAHGADVILVGGKGDDKLFGSRGDDYRYWGEYDGTETVNYIWNIGDGNDTITNTSNLVRAKKTGGTSYLRMGEGITAENLKFIRNETENAYIKNIDTDEEITVKDWFKDDAFKLDGVIFSDGSMLNRDELVEKFSKFETTDGDDTLIGNSNNDTLDGGKGNDYLEGGKGDDTYIYGIGYGNDTINNTIRNLAGKSLDSGNDKLLFNDEIKKEDVLWQSDKDDMLATIIDMEETLRIKNWFKKLYSQAFKKGVNM